MHYRGLFVGLTTIDIQYFVDDFPNRNTKVKTNVPDILVGGPAANAAVAFSYLNKGAQLATVVGVNSFTSFIQNDFCDTNIQLCDIAKSQKINPIVASVVTSKNGDRTILTHNPLEIQPEINAKRVLDEIQAQIILLDGFYPEFSIECAKFARANNIPVVIDGGSWKPQYEDLLPYIDIAICSADFFPPDCSTHDDVFTFLTAHGVNKMAISRGERSMLFRDGQKKGEVQIKPTKVVDTLGAGDFLHGAFCYYFLESGNFKVALSKAVKLASRTCAYNGTRKWLKF